MRLFALTVIAAVAPATVLLRWPDSAVTLGARPVAVRVDVSSVRTKLLATAASPSRTLFVRLDGVSAARQPGVVWRVYLGVTPSSKPQLAIGTLALYADGLRTTHPFKPATFSYAADKAVTTLLGHGGHRLSLRFVAFGPLIGGKPSKPHPAADVRVTRISFVTLEG
jgi:hypothetical protein